MSWARRLKRVFDVEIECCARCGGQLKIIASIEEPQLIAKILSERAAPEQYQSELPLRKRGPAAAAQPAVNWRMSSDSVSGRGRRTGSPCPKLQRTAEWVA
jgi:hypothetical protein